MKILPQSLKVKNEQGNVAIIIAISLVAFISFTALSLDIGYALVTRNQLQNVADASALAAARELGHIYEGLTLAQQAAVTVSAERSTLVLTAQNAASANTAGGVSISINDSDVIIGQWTSATKTLTPNADPPDAVKVTARRDASANGPITTFFAKIFGINTTNVSASATAALTGQGTAPLGGLPLPVGIGLDWFSASIFCNQPIRFYPTGTGSCAGWNTYTTSPASANNLRNILEGLNDGTFQSPETHAGQTLFMFSGGNIASDFPYMQTLFNTMRIKNDGVLDRDTDPNTWTTSVVVYANADGSDPGCSNPNGSMMVVGFATVTITSVLTSPSNTINGVVDCNSFDSGGRGGGGDVGTKGTIPGLVQ